MKKNLAIMLSIIIFGLSSLLSADFQWPVEEMQNSFISAYFGESREDHFHNGIDLAPKSSKVYPVDNGEMIFYWDNSNSLYPEEFGIGKTIVLQHSKTRSYYSHLKEITEKKKTNFLKRSQIGIIGNTGRSSANHLHLGIRKDHLNVNPIDLLPKITEIQEPVIKNIVFKSGYFQKMVQSNQGNNKVYLPLRDHFVILIDAFDTISEKSYKRNIRKIAITISGSQGAVFEKSLSFDFLKDGKLNGIFSFKEIYSKIWNESFFIMGKWEKKSRKENYQMAVTAVDNLGNKTVVNKTIIFR